MRALPLALLPPCPLCCPSAAERSCAAETKICRPDDVFLSYLPLAHIFDRVAEEMFLHLTARIGYWQGSAKTLMDDVVALRPTVFVAVPRILDRLYAGITDKVLLAWTAPLAPHQSALRQTAARGAVAGGERWRCAAVLVRLSLCPQAAAAALWHLPSACCG